MATIDPNTPVTRALLDQAALEADRSVRWLWIISIVQGVAIGAHLCNHIMGAL